METPFLDDENDRKLVIYDTCPSGSVIKMDRSHDKTRTANVLNCFKNDRSSKFIGDVTFKKFVVYVEMKVKVYVNQGKSLSHIKIRHAYDFSLCFPHELLQLISYNFSLNVANFVPNEVVKFKSSY